MITPKVAELVERQFTTQRILEQTRTAAHAPYPQSPCCGAELSGTSSVLWCCSCGSTVHASHLDREVPSGGGR